jgi:hypothetical protein
MTDFRDVLDRSTEEDFRVAFNLDRVDGTLALPMLRPENVKVRGDRATIELQLSAEHEIELYFPAPGGNIEAVWLALAADVLAHLTAIDNEVQRVSADQYAAATRMKNWADSPYPSSYFEGELAYITLTEGARAVLGYFIIGCNSNWHEMFVRIAGQWVRVADAEQSVAPDFGGAT